MANTRKRIPNQLSPKKKLKWWFKNNYIYLSIVGGVCLLAALILIFEVYHFERTKNMEALLQKSRKDMRWGGITDHDVEILKKQYPNINWDSTYDRERWKKGNKNLKELQSENMSKRKLRRERELIYNDK